ncbi:MBL fold metallo-hydrolase [Novosphingobium sp. YJ-S2-02]|uniref:MBL fold metallo-hydrolase n=1 Tax=Novosphingobium aureum TaxID=2792964 RepID=A0A931HAU6_9SPHN|nr:MBL fold metallo-hydrolase [Novosphingobium aureum]MBH0112590.1 MBL fold metallo-hydrolase [Novosphingobium aureum]
MTTTSSGFALGEHAVHAIVDEDCFEIDLARMFPDADPDALAVYDWLDPWHYAIATRRIRLGMHSFLVRTPSLNILVDMCVGDHKERPAHSAWNRRSGASLIASLAAIGLAPEDIDLVFCTHLHADHVGWNTQLVDGRWVPTFPRARYAMGREELTYWAAQASTSAQPETINHGAYADSVLPVLASGQAMEVAPGDSLFTGQRFTDLAGHTPGHLGMEISGGDRTVLFCGDAIHSPLQLPFPDLSSAFCSDRAQSARTRRAMLDEAAERGLWLCPAHFRGERIVRIARQGEAYRLRD